MDKRLALTIGLSILVLFGWSAFVSKTQPIDNKQVIVNSTAVNNVQSVIAPTTLPAPKPAELSNILEKTLPYK